MLNITQQRSLLSALTETVLMMQIAEGFKSVSPAYYNDRMAVLEPQYRQQLQDLVNSVHVGDVCEHEFVQVGEETTCCYCGIGINGICHICGHARTDCRCSW